MKNRAVSFLPPLLAIATLTLAIPVTYAQTTAPGYCPPETAAPGCHTGRRSLTVIGRGQVTATADTAIMEFRFASRDSSVSETLSPGLSLPAARRQTEGALQPAITALQTAGIPARNITLQTYSVQSPKLLVVVDKPTQDGLQELVLQVEQSLATSQTIFLQGIGAGYAVNTCEALERSARRLALRDAQRQMATLAQDVNVALGELLSVTVLPLVGASASVGCGTKAGMPVSSFPFTSEETTPPYNPADKPQVQVRSEVSVTHAIQGDRK